MIYKKGCTPKRFGDKAKSLLIEESRETGENAEHSRIRSA
jgi:hypothetical protein